MDLKLDDKVAVVTGGAKGIGHAVVAGLLSEKARVIVIDRDNEACEKIVAQFGAENVATMAGDLTDEKTCGEAIRYALGEYGRIDILVNNAGVNDSTGFDCSRQEFLSSLEKNLLHVVSMTQLAAEELRLHNGAIVNISSKVAVTGQGGTTGYAAAKGAINALTREWALEFASFEVNVNTVVPAECWTPLYEHWINSQPDPAAVKKSISDLVPLGNRFTSAEEIANTVVFLASPRASHITGQLIFVDGGYTHLDRKATVRSEFHWSNS